VSLANLRHGVPGAAASRARDCPELKVDALVEGSALRSGDRVASSPAQLVDAADGTIIWSETYERGMRDVLALQGDVARAIARRIRGPTLAPGVEERSGRGRCARRVRGLPQGPLFSLSVHTDALEKAEVFFDRALEKDPSLALAHAGLADINVVRSFSGFAPPAEALEQAQQHAMRAIQLDDQLRRARVPGVGPTFRTGTGPPQERVPAGPSAESSNALARDELLASCWRRWAESRTALLEGSGRGNSIPCRSRFTRRNASVLIGAGRYDEAVAVCQEALRMNAGFFWAHHHLWRAYARQGVRGGAGGGARIVLGPG